MNYSVEKFKKVVVVFWTLWWLVAFLTDFTGGLEKLGLLHAKWIYTNNLPGLVKALSMYSAPHWLSVALFIGIILWSLLSTLLFLHASLSMKHDKTVWQARVNRAFAVSLSFWLAFFLADQMTMKFVLEQNHMVQGGFELLCWLAFYILRDDKPFLVNDNLG